MAKKNFICLSLLLAFITLSMFVYPADAKEPAFRETLDLLKKALIDQNMDIVNLHLDINSIVGDKVHKYAGLTKGKGSFFSRSLGKAMDFSEPLITKGITAFAMREYKKSTLGERRSRIDSLKIKKYKVEGAKAIASGIFLQQPATIYAINKDGRWVVVKVDSPLIDEEIRNIMRVKER